MVVEQKWQQGGTVVDNHVVIPIMQTIIDAMPIAQMIIFVGDDNGDGGRGNGGGGSDATL